MDEDRWRTLEEALTDFLKPDETAAQLVARVSRPPLRTGVFFAPTLRAGYILELAGPSGSAKTEILIQAAANQILPDTWEGCCLGGHAENVVYIDLDAKLDPLRLLQVLHSRVDIEVSQRALSISEETVNHFCESSLARFHLISCDSSTDFLAALSGLPALLARLKEQGGVSLLLIDNIAAFYWLDRAVREGPPGPGTGGPRPPCGTPMVPPGGPGPALSQTPSAATYPALGGPPAPGEGVSWVPGGAGSAAVALCGDLLPGDLGGNSWIPAGPGDPNVVARSAAPVGLHQVSRAVAGSLRKLMQEHKLAAIVSQNSFLLPSQPPSSSGWGSPDAGPPLHNDVTHVSKAVALLVLRNIPTRTRVSVCKGKLNEGSVSQYSARGFEGNTSEDAIADLTSVCVFLLMYILT
eukprot:jgi/Botrbrau1/7501/Bobra.0095s0037.1